MAWKFSSCTTPSAIKESNSQQCLTMGYQCRSSYMSTMTQIPFATLEQSLLEGECIDLLMLMVIASWCNSIVHQGHFTLPQKDALCC